MEKVNAKLIVKSSWRQATIPGSMESEIIDHQRQLWVAICLRPTADFGIDSMSATVYLQTGRK